MKNRFTTLTIALAAVFTLSFAAAPAVYAADDCADSTKTSFNWGAACAKTENVISTIFKLLAGVVGVAVVIGIAWGGMLYTTSNGNASKAQAGVTAIVNSIIGLLVFIFMFAISNYIVPGGILG